MNLVEYAQKNLRGIKGPVRATDAIKYDTIRLAAAAAADTTPRNFFAVCIAQNGDGFTPKTIAETNNTESGKMPGERGMVVDSIGIEVIPTNALQSTAPGDIAAIYRQCGLIIRNSTLTYISGDYQRQLGPFSHLPGGAGPVLGTDQAVALAGGMLAFANGSPAPSARRRLSEPLLLQPGQSFNFMWQLTQSIVTISGTQAGIDVRVVLFGADLTVQLPQG